MGLEKHTNLQQNTYIRNFLRSNVMAPVLTHKHKTSLERVARDKHSSLLRTFTNYGRKKGCKIGPQWQTGREKGF
jgi:hypothetical protein